MTEQRKHQLLLGIGIAVPILTIIAQGTLGAHPLAAGWTIAEGLGIVLQIAGRVQVALGGASDEEQSAAAVWVHRVLIGAGIAAPLVASLAGHASPETTTALVGSSVAAVLADLSKARGKQPIGAA
jgi:hypothetical protein